MEYAKTNGYAVFTNDLDFGAILAVDIENGALVTIDPRKVRVTMLPLSGFGT